LHLHVHHNKCDRFHNIGPCLFLHKLACIILIIRKFLNMWMSWGINHIKSNYESNYTSLHRAKCELSIPAMTNRSSASRLQQRLQKRLLVRFFRWVRTVWSMQVPSCRVTFTENIAIRLWSSNEWPTKQRNNIFQYSDNVKNRWLSFSFVVKKGGLIWVLFSYDIFVLR